MGGRLKLTLVRRNRAGHINAKVLELSHDHWFGDQIALEALVRFSDEELKHQELFRRIETLVAERMPPGYRFTPQPDGVAGRWSSLLHERQF